MKKTIKKTSIILIVIISVIFAIVAIFYWKSVSKNEMPHIINSEFTGDIENIHLGDKLTFNINVETPWHISLDEKATHLEKGISKIGKLNVSLNSISFGSFNRQITTYLTPYRTGLLKCGVIDIKYNHNNQTKILSCKIPTITVKPIEVDTIEPKLAEPIKLTLIEKIKKVIKDYKWIFLSIFIVLIGLIIYFIIKKRKELPIPIIPPWDVAISAITKLKRKIEQHNILNEECIDTLTDIIRVYLEKRFDLHAPTQTTNEFLKDLNSSSSPLQNNHKSFLREFMQSSEFVKFAKLPVEKDIINDAISKAKSLVLETRIKENLK